MVKVTQKSLKLIAVSKESSLDIFKKKKETILPQTSMLEFLKEI